MTRRRPRRTKYSRAEAPLWTVRERDAGNGQLVRMIKIRMDGPPGRRWIPYATWWWQQNRGPVPPGKRICHADGNLLNDHPDNLVALTPGEVFKLYHRLNPEMSRRNRAACGRAAARRNAETARIRRETSWLACRWYAVDLEARVIINVPHRKRWMVYRDHGFAERLRNQVALARNGDTAAAAYVMEQAQKLDQYWRWMRSASLGWPGVNCMCACILSALADADELASSQLVATVSEMRRLFDWNPHQLTNQVLSSIVSAHRHWIYSRRTGAGAVYGITGAAITARLPGPRIVAIRGRHLTNPRFTGYRKVSPQQIEEAA